MDIKQFNKTRINKRKFKFKKLDEQTKKEVGSSVLAGINEDVDYAEGSKKRR